MKVLAKQFQGISMKHQTLKVVAELLAGIGLLGLFALAVMIAIAAINVG